MACRDSFLSPAVKVLNCCVKCLMSLNSVYIVAARRTALGRLGGIHGLRRLVELAGPVIEAVIADASLTPADVQAFFLGNASETGNPARAVALGAGLSDTVPSMTIDRHCASGLDAVLAGARSISLGEADIVVAGGAEALSTAPWRVVKPVRANQFPRFAGSDHENQADLLEEEDDFARELGIDRLALDLCAAEGHVRADTAQAAKRFVREIVPLRSNVAEARDEAAVGLSVADLESIRPFTPPNGLSTPGNVSEPVDGAAFVILVSEACWVDMGKPAALRLAGYLAQGVGADQVAVASAAVLQDLVAKLSWTPAEVGAVEIGERSALEALYLARSTGVEPGRINADGGAIARGLPLGAASGVSLVRLFSRLVRGETRKAGEQGVVAQSTVDGLAIAAAFEAVGG